MRIGEGFGKMDIAGLQSGQNTKVTKQFAEGIFEGALRGVPGEHYAFGAAVLSSSPGSGVSFRTREPWYKSKR